MYVVTNRRLTRDSGDLGLFSKEPNRKGPNELRLVNVTKVDSKPKPDGKYEAVVIKEGLISPQEKAAMARRYKIDAADPVLAARGRRTDS
jgi:hypothetical protein